MDIGETLKKRRKQLNYTLQRVHSDTRISTSFLDALESNSFNKFPAELYLIGSLKKYALYLGLQPDVLIEELTAQKIISKAEKKSVQSAPASAPAQETKREDVQQASKQQPNVPMLSEVFVRSIPVMAAVAVVLIALLFSFSWYTNLSNTTRVSKTDALYTKYRFFKNRLERTFDLPDNLVISVQANEKAWIQIKNPSTLFFEGFLPKDQSITFSTDSAFNFYSDKPTSLRITLNDLSVDIQEAFKNGLRASKFTKEYFRELRRTATLRGIAIPKQQQ